MTIPVPRLELLNVTKRYPTIVANDDVSLSVLPGEIHAVLGENGAGKSTLMKIIYGAVKADSGTVMLERPRGAIANPAQARRLGIGMVFQHFSLFETLTVAENIALVLDEPFDLPALAIRVKEVSEHTACRSTRTGWCTACPSANASASRSCAACCRTRSC
jgi:general nucleoside transport system ATP-binding protein